MEFIAIVYRGSAEETRSAPFGVEGPFPPACTGLEYQTSVAVDKLMSKRVGDQMVVSVREIPMAWKHTGYHRLERYKTVIERVE